MRLKDHENKPICLTMQKVRLFLKIDALEDCAD
jgi:hypothetical protein